MGSISYGALIQQPVRFFLNGDGVLQLKTRYMQAQSVDPVLVLGPESDDVYIVGPETFNDAYNAAIFQAALDGNYLAPPDNAYVLNHGTIPRTNSRRQIAHGGQASGSGPVTALFDAPTAVGNAIQVVVTTRGTGGAHITGCTDDTGTLTFSEASTAVSSGGLVEMAFFSLATQDDFGIGTTPSMQGVSIALSASCAVDIWALECAFLDPEELLPEVVGVETGTATAQIAVSGNLPLAFPFVFAACINEPDQDPGVPIMGPYDSFFHTVTGTVTVHDLGHGVNTGGRAAYADFGYLNGAQPGPLVAAQWNDIIGSSAPFIGGVAPSIKRPVVTSGTEYVINDNPVVNLGP